MFAQCLKNKLKSILRGLSRGRSLARRLDPSQESGLRAQVLNLIFGILNNFAALKYSTWICLSSLRGGVSRRSNSALYQPHLDYFTNFEVSPRLWSENYRILQCNWYVPIVLFLLLFATSVVADSGSHIKHKLVTTRTNIGKLHTDLAVKHKESRQLLKELQTVEQSMNVASKDLYNLAATLQQEQKIYNELQAKFIATDTEYKRRQKLLAKQIKLSFQLGKMPQIKFLLGNYEPAQLERLLKYYEYIHQQQQQKLNACTTTLAEIKLLQAAMAEKIASINAKKLAKSKLVAKLKYTKSNRAVLLGKIKQSIIKNQQTLTVLQRDEKELESKITQLQGRQRRQPSTAMSNKAIFDQFFPHPPIIRKTAKIRMRAISTANANRFLIQAEPGSKVHAVNNGRVIFASWLRGYGLLLIIEHNNDLMSLYGHNQTLLKKVGDKVERGEVIALVGQSGGQMLPGLYFEVRKAAKSIDLRNWFGYETT